jgi:hypothetical protein
MPLKLKSRLPYIAFFFFIGLLAFELPNGAHGDLLEETGYSTGYYLVEMSGKVLNEEFSDARASLEISPPNPDSLNPYLVIMRGFPKSNSQNTLYWHSDGSDMTVLGDDITCDVKRSFMRPPKEELQCHFFYLSPFLIKPIKGYYLPQNVKEMKDLAIKHALPTRVYAKAGQLRVKVTSHMVSGSVWMKGYDLIEHSYVEYNVSFAGEMTTRIKPSWQIKEPQRPIGGTGAGKMFLKYK